MPHTIRLRGPWRHDPTNNRFTRRFHQPTGLTTASRVWLVIDNLDAIARVELNDAPLGQAAPAVATRLEITGRLKPSNFLSLTFDPVNSGDRQPAVSSAGEQEPPVSLAGRVALQIDEQLSQN